MFDIINDEPEITAEGLYVPEMREIWQKDETVNKDKAKAYLAYIYHTTNPASLYSNLETIEREQVVCTDYLKEGGRKYRVPKYVTEAREKYRLLITTPEERALEAATVLSDKLSQFMIDVDLTELDEMGKPIHNVNALLTSLGKMDAVVKSIQELRDRVKKGLSTKEQFRGGAEINMFD